MTPNPRSLKNDGDQLIIEWDDGHTHRLPWTLVREKCPCATCATEKSKPVQLLPVLDISAAKPPRPTAFEPMGNYAYSIAFSDGHSSGIYTLEFLYQLGQQQAEVGH